MAKLLFLLAVVGTVGLAAGCAYLRNRRAIAQLAGPPSS